MRKPVSPLVSILVILLCLATVGVVWKRLTDLGPRPDLTSPKGEARNAGVKPCVPPGPPALPVNGVWQKGEPGAVLQVEAVLEMPSKEGEPEDPLCSWLRRFAGNVPHRMRAVIYDLDSEAGRAEMKRRGLKGPFIFINGKHEFETRLAARNRHVDLTKLSEQRVVTNLLAACVSDEFITQFYFGGKKQISSARKDSTTPTEPEARVSR